MSHVFISYSRANKSYAYKLADYLIKQGFDVWIDNRINFGQVWLDEINSSLADRAEACGSKKGGRTPNCES